MKGSDSASSVSSHLCLLLLLPLLLLLLLLCSNAAAAVVVAADLLLACSCSLHTVDQELSQRNAACTGNAPSPPTHAPPRFPFIASHSRGCSRLSVGTDSCGPPIHGSGSSTDASGLTIQMDGSKVVLASTRGSFRGVYMKSLQDLAWSNTPAGASRNHMCCRNSLHATIVSRVRRHRRPQSMRRYHRHSPPPHRRHRPILSRRQHRLHRWPVLFHHCLVVFSMSAAYISLTTQVPAASIFPSRVAACMHPTALAHPPSSSSRAATAPVLLFLNCRCCSVARRTLLHGPRCHVLHLFIIQRPVLPPVCFCNVMCMYGPFVVWTGWIRCVRARCRCVLFDDALVLDSDVTCCVVCVAAADNRQHCTIQIQSRSCPHQSHVSAADQHPHRHRQVNRAPHHVLLSFLCSLPTTFSCSAHLPALTSLV